MIRTLILTTTFLSAFLLFVVQPLYAKYLFPFFGGTSTVWTVSIFFYSVTLLLGCLYASLLTRWPSRTARLIHTSLMIITGALLLGRWLGMETPLLVETVIYNEPALSVFFALLHALGLPVLLLASTSVIAQHLFAKYTEEEPYYLYALSNAGSLIGLAVYPFLLEPFTTLTTQAAAWVLGFVIFLLLMQAVWRQVEHFTGQVEVTLPVLAPLRSRARIVAMAAIPTFLLASVTEFLSKGIASFPLLWVIPLMLYLVSFIIAFGDRRSLTPMVPLGAWTLLSLVLIVSVLPILSTNATIYWIGFGFFMVGFLLVSTYFHRRVYELRPRVEELGSFYVYVTLGGALGSGVVGILLPLLLNDAIELYFVLGVLTVYFAVRYPSKVQVQIPKIHVRGVQLLFLALAISSTVYMLDTKSLASERNFYGTVKVRESWVSAGEDRVLIRSIVNGETNHGFQVQDERYNLQPASYYGPSSGIGLAIDSFVERGSTPEVNVVGLGLGAVAAYCGQVAGLSFVDINPAVEPLAREYFTYLSFCSHKVEVFEGDGRLWLQSSSEEYDIIMMDAFTDDAVPAHLLTVEAFEEVYLPRLSEEGVLAFHISNKYLDLHPPIVGAARQAGYEAVLVVSRPEVAGVQLPSSWVLVTRPEYVERLTTYENAVQYTGKEIVWNDYKNSVLSVLTLSGSFKKD